MKLSLAVAGTVTVNIVLVGWRFSLWWHGHLGRVFTGREARATLESKIRKEMERYGKQES